MEDGQSCRRCGDFSECAHAESGCAARGILGKAIENAKELAFHQKISGINRTVNRVVRYVPDAENYGTKDYWAIPDEILASGKGPRKVAGLPSEAMSIVVLRDIRRTSIMPHSPLRRARGHFISP